MANRAYKDGEKIAFVKEPENVEEEVINDILMQGFEGEAITEEEAEDLL